MKMLADVDLMNTQIDFQALRESFGERLVENISLAPFTAARIGGPADALLEAVSADDLAQVIQVLWEIDAPFVVLGGGSNVLVSDEGLRKVVVLNHARGIRFAGSGEDPQVWAESGANFGSIARQAASRGFSGLEWAAGIPGTLGGAIFGNAGAFGHDMTNNLLTAEILSKSGSEEKRGFVRENWSVEQFKYRYRDSILKRQSTQGAQASPQSPQAVILSGWLRLGNSSPEEVKSRMDALGAQRRQTQPPGASMGSMFKNPPGDYAGRLIEACGLKGTQAGRAQISTLHANFFINLGGATAADVSRLISLARDEVEQNFGIKLQLEIELLGSFSGLDRK